MFESAANAVAAANTAQQQIELPVRMGIHTGDAEEPDGDFFGMTLNRCARIMAAGHSGRVLLSSVTAGLSDDEFAERILQLGTTTFLALRVATRRSVVPAVLTSLVGRDELVRQVVERLETARLVTMVGVGGVGKTLVAIAATKRVEADRDLTVFVPLNEVSDDQEVLPALGRALGLTTPTQSQSRCRVAGR
ncbi:MAG: hypothetical protein ACKVHU_08695 [Acidimicrobiales bacterium]